MANEVLEAIHRMREGGDFRSPHPSAGWFKLSEFDDAVKRCRICKGSHLFSPTKTGYWSGDFVCLHCADSKSTYASTDQGIYIGEAFIEYGQAHYEWKEKCICCRSEFFYERSTLKERTEGQKSRDTEGSIYRHRGGKMKNTTLKYFCDRCDGSTGLKKRPVHFGFVDPPNWSSDPPSRPRLPEEKPFCKARIVFRPPAVSNRTRPEPHYPTPSEKKVLLKKAKEKVEKLVERRNAKLAEEDARIASGKTGPRRPQGALTANEIKRAQMRAAGIPLPKPELPPLSKRAAILESPGGFKFTWEKFSPWPWMRADQKRVEKQDPKTIVELRKLLKTIAKEKADAELEKAQNHAYLVARIEAEESKLPMFGGDKYEELFLKAYNAEMNRIYALGKIHEPFRDFRKAALEELLAKREAKKLSAETCAPAPKKAGGSGPRSRGYRVADGRKVEPSTL